MTRTLSCALFCTLLASPALAGPPWIAIEYPANPHHASTRGAALLVRAYHHSTALRTPVRGTMEGIVDGKRVSVPLEIESTNMAGVFAVRSALPTSGTWVLAISLEQDGGAGAIVTLDGRGRIAHVQVPSSRNREGWTIPRALQARDIDAALRDARVAHVDDSGLPIAGLAGLLGVPLLLIGFGRSRRERGRRTEA